MECVFVHYDDVRDFLSRYFLCPQTVDVDWDRTETMSSGSIRSDFAALVDCVALIG